MGMGNWKSYNGEYAKEFYDIKLHNGDVHENCWPNAGTFHTEQGHVVPEDMVEYYCESGDKAYP
jgi:hypothetical protein